MWYLSLSLCVNFRRGTSAGCLQITGLVFQSLVPLEKKIAKTGE